MTPEFFDIHAHVNFAAFDSDRGEVLERAKEQNVWMINVGTQKDTSKSAVELTKSREGVFATVGLHPIHTDKSYHDKKELGHSFAKASAGKDDGFVSRGEVFDYDYYKELAGNEKVVAVGECGLDYYRLGEDTKRKQKEAFEQQIALANEVKKPLMLHIRDAYRDAFDVVRANAKVKGNVHFFAGSWEEAKLFLDIGFTLSFTGVITFARDYDEVIKNAPLDMIMSETDCPYVAPAPHRGKRNEPVYVKEVVKQIALIRGENFEKVQVQLVENALRVFSISP